MSVSIGELIKQAQDLEYLQLQVIEIGGAEKAVPHMTSKQFDLFYDSKVWADYVSHLTNEQIEELTDTHLQKMDSKVSEIQNINQISIDGDASSPFMSIDHKSLTPEQVESLDVEHIQQLIKNNELSSLEDKVPHLNAENLADAASNIDGISPTQLAPDKLSQEQINELISRVDPELDQLVDSELQAQYVANNDVTPNAAVEFSAEPVAESAALSAGTIIACVVAAIIVLALMFKIFREK